MSAPQPAARLFQVSIVNAILGVVTLSLFGPAVVSIIKRWNAPASFDPAGPADACFMLGCVATIILILRVFEWRWIRLCVSWLLVSLPMALIGAFIPFGDATVSLRGACPDGFHGFCGQGAPLPVVIWDDGMDYPSPLGFYLNWPLLFIAGIVLFVILRALAVWYRNQRTPIVPKVK